MIQVGDIVKIDIDAVLENSAMSLEPLTYILDNPEELYAVRSTEGLTLAPIQVDHPIVGDTSFFEDELILV